MAELGQLREGAAAGIRLQEPGEGSPRELRRAGILRGLGGGLSPAGGLRGTLGLDPGLEGQGCRGIEAFQLVQGGLAGGYDGGGIGLQGEEGRCEESGQVRQGGGAGRFDLRSVGGEPDRFFRFLQVLLV